MSAHDTSTAGQDRPAMRLALIVAAVALLVTGSCWLWALLTVSPVLRGLTTWGGDERVFSPYHPAVWLARVFWVNWFLGLINLLLVGFPLDGGRILQSSLWPWLGYRQATLTAVFPPPKFGDLKLSGHRVTTFAEKAPGGYRSKHQVYDRAGEKCRRCRGVIERIVLTGRSTCFCPRCQPR